MELQRGMRDKIDKYADLSYPIEVDMNITGPGVYDFCCFGVDAADKLSDERYMVFYNQTSSPGGEIRYSISGSTASFSVQLGRLPMNICKLVFTASIDGISTMSNIAGLALRVKQNGNAFMTLNMSGADFSREKAVIAVEIYRKDSWRINAVARGFNGGLGDLLRAYGGEEETGSPTPAPTPAPAPSPAPMPARAPSPAPAQNRISLEKKLSDGAPQLVSLAKPIRVQLEKRNLLDVVARVALVMDISGSMTMRYRDGTVQSIVNHILPLAVQFDDDGELDFWYYGTRPQRMDSVNMKNYQSAVPRNWDSLMNRLGYGNNEPAVMEHVIREYKKSRLPAYVIFVTDGGVGSTSTIKKLLTDASRSPIFWQFVGVGGSNYGVLEDLDNMGGRYVDNANFFALDDFRSISNDELYSRLLNEFPGWLKEIRKKGMI